MLSALLFVTLLLGGAVFQASLALGAPLGRFAWGGRHPGTLPTSLRLGSGAAVGIYALIATLALDRAGAVAVFPDAVPRVGMWIVVAVLALSVLANALSRSRAERNLWTPLSAALAVLALIVALA